MSVFVERIADPRGREVARKGGGKGGGAPSPTTPHTPVEYPNTLRSLATVRLLEVLSEGPVWGIEQQGAPTIWAGVYLDGTAIDDLAGNHQFNITEGYFRYGTPGQDWIPGYPMAEAEFSVGVKTDYAVPIVRAVSDLGISAVRYTIQIPAMYTNESDGDVVGASVAYAFDIQIDGGLWTNVVTERIYGKTMSPYQRSVRITLPAYTTSAQIRIIRISYDPPSDTTCDLFWSSYTEIQDGQLSYDDTCVVSLTVDAEQFPNVPQRAYLLRGTMMQIPTSYNGITHGDTLDWDGTFYTQWTNNPAWVLYNFLINERWGIGRFLDPASVDKWSFYEAQQYNDNSVPDGRGGSEVRFTCNGVLNTRQDAWQVLTAIASSMMATLYYASGTVFLVQDRPLFTPERLFSPADVELGLFDYTGADYRSVFNAAAITWNDPTDQYKPAVELVLDGPLVAEQGYKETQQTAFGCTSRGQAIRLGRWLIYTSQFETEVVTFRTSIENADLRPGMLIAISDPGMAGARLGGRLLSDGGVDTVTLDRLPDEIATSPASWTLYVTTGNATAGETVSVIGLGVVAALGGNQLRVTGKPVHGLAVGAMWMAWGTEVEPTTWRINIVVDMGKGQYQVTATEYHVEKFNYVENGWLIAPPPYSLIPSGPLKAPTNLKALEYIYLDGSGFPQFGAIISWSAAPDPRVAYYQLEASGPSGDYRRFERIIGVSQDLPAMRQGQWTIVIKSFDNLGRHSQLVTFTFLPIGLSAKPLPPQALYITPQGGNQINLIWTPTGEIDVLYYWVKYAPQTDGSAVWERATTSIAQVSRSTTQVTTPSRAGTYMVKSIDALGQESDSWIDAILIPQQTEQTVVIDNDEAPGFAGTTDGLWTVSSPELLLPPPTAPEPIPPGVFPGDRYLAFNQMPTRVGVYLFAAGLDLGAVTRVTMTGIVDGHGTFGSTTMSAWVPLAAANPLAGANSAQWDAHIECSVSQDGTTFDEWFPLKSTFITGRAFQWRLIGTLFDLATTLHCLQASVLIEVPSRSVQGSDVAIDGTGHLVVTYAAPFLATPSVQITARQTLGPGETIVVTESDATHFKVEQRDASGAAVTGGSIDYYVVGYGGHA